MIVKAGNDLSFKVQGQRIGGDKKAYVTMTHDIKMKLKNGSLIDMDKIGKPIKIKSVSKIKGDK